MLDEIKLIFFRVSATTCGPWVEAMYQHPDRDPHNRSRHTAQYSSLQPAELLLSQIRADANKDGEQEQFDWIAQVHRDLPFDARKLAISELTVCA